MNILSNKMLKTRELKHQIKSKIKSTKTKCLDRLIVSTKDLNSNWKNKEQSPMINLFRTKKCRIEIRSILISRVLTTRNLTNSSDRVQWFQDHILTDRFQYNPLHLLINLNSNRLIELEHRVKCQVVPITILYHHQRLIHHQVVQKRHTQFPTRCPTKLE